MTKNDATIQDKMTQLSKLVEWFDSDDFQLELAIDKFREAETLAEKIASDLKDLKNDIEVVKKKFDQSE